MRGWCWCSRPTKRGEIWTPRGASETTDQQSRASHVYKGELIIRSKQLAIYPRVETWILRRVRREPKSFLIKNMEGNRNILLLVFTGADRNWAAFSTARPVDNYFPVKVYKLNKACPAGRLWRLEVTLTEGNYSLGKHIGCTLVTPRPPFFLFIFYLAQFLLNTKLSVSLEGKRSEN